MLYEFTWDPGQMPFVIEKGKQLIVGWINQMNKPAYYDPILYMNLPGRTLFWSFTRIQLWTNYNDNSGFGWII